MAFTGGVADMGGGGLTPAGGGETSGVRGVTGVTLVGGGPLSGGKGGGGKRSELLDGCGGGVRMKMSEAGAIVVSASAGDKSPKGAGAMLLPGSAAGKSAQLVGT